MRIRTLSQGVQITQVIHTYVRIHPPVHCSQGCQEVATWGPGAKEVSVAHSLIYVFIYVGPVCIIIIIIITSSDDIQPSTVITNQSPAD